MANRLMKVAFFLCSLSLIHGVASVQCGGNTVTFPLFSDKIRIACDSYTLRFTQSEGAQRLVALINVGQLAANNFCEIYEGSDESGTLAGTLMGGQVAFPVVIDGPSTFVSCVTNLTTEETRLTIYKAAVCEDDATGPEYNLMSPNFPSNYPDRSGCVWRFEMESITSLVFRFLTFHTENRYDILYFQDEENNVETYTGNLGAFEIQVNTTSLTVIFVSDGGTEETGFNATVDFIGIQTICDMKGVNLDEMLTTIPDKCDYFIRRFQTSQGSTRMVAHLQSGQLAANNFCKIYEGTDESGVFAGTLGGGGLPLPVVIDSASAYVACVTNLTTGDVVINIHPASQCGENTSGLVYNLKSPDFPSQYPSWTGCVWTFAPLDSLSFWQFQFSTFDIEDGNDFVYLMEDDESVTRLTGNLGTFVYNATLRSLMFLSNFENQQMGFNATVRKANLSRVTAEEQITLDYELGDTLYIALDRETPLADLHDNCKVTGSDPVFVFDIDQCEGNYKNENSVVSVSFLVWRFLALSPSFIQREVQNKINVTCLFDADVLLSSSNIQPQIESNQISTHNTAALDVALNLFNNEYFNESLSGEVTVPNYVFAEIKLVEISANNDDFIVQLENCWATRVENSSGLPSYPIVQSGCVAPVSGSEAANAKMLMRNYQSNFATFKLMSFAWTDVSDVEQFIYIHCDVAICQNSTGQCARQTCADKRRRSVDNNGHNQQLSAGPVHILQTTKRLVIQSSLQESGRDEIKRAAYNTFHFMVFVLLGVVIIGAGYLVWYKIVPNSKI